MLTISELPKILHETNLRPYFLNKPSWHWHKLMCIKHMKSDHSFHFDPCGCSTLRTHYITLACWISQIKLWWGFLAYLHGGPRRFRNAIFIFPCDDAARQWWPRHRPNSCHHGDKQELNRRRFGETRQSERCEKMCENSARKVKMYDRMKRDEQQLLTEIIYPFVNSLFFWFITNWVQECSDRRTCARTSIKTFHYQASNDYFVTTDTMNTCLSCGKVQEVELLLSPSGRDDTLPAHTPEGWD